MGAFDIFEIVATGKGAHAAMAYTGKDPMLFVTHAISALQMDRRAQPGEWRRLRSLLIDIK
jgi:metal-dependent amidase/aminoacylase/carboxypeptidase family protein